MIIKSVPAPPTWVRMSKLGADFKGIDPIDSTDEVLQNANKPHLEEPSLSHPFNTSTIKIRNNGMIDAFVASNQGFRLDPATKTMNLIVDGLKEHLNYFRAWIWEDAHWWTKQSVIYDVEESFFNVNAYTDIVLNAGRDVIINAGRDVKITAGVNIYENAGVDVNVKANSNINGTAGGNATTKAGGSIYEKASTIFMN